MYKILKGDLKQPSIFKEKLYDYIMNIRAEILKQYSARGKEFRIG